MQKRSPPGIPRPRVAARRHPLATTSTSSSRSRAAGAAAALGLGVEALVLGPPDVADDGGVAGEPAAEDDDVADGGLGAAAPDDGEHGEDEGPAEEAEGEAGEVQGGAVDPGDDLEDEDEEGEGEAEDDDVRAVVQGLQEAGEERLDERVGEGE